MLQHMTSEMHEKRCVAYTTELVSTSGYAVCIHTVHQLVTVFCRIFPRFGNHQLCPFWGALRDLCLHGYNAAYSSPFSSFYIVQRASNSRRRGRVVEADARSAIAGWCVHLCFWDTSACLFMRACFRVLWSSFFWSAVSEWSWQPWWTLSNVYRWFSWLSVLSVSFLPAEHQAQYSRRHFF